MAKKTNQNKLRAAKGTCPRCRRKVYLVKTSSKQVYRFDSWQPEPKKHRCSVRGLYRDPSSLHDWSPRRRGPSRRHSRNPGRRSTEQRVIRR